MYVGMWTVNRQLTNWTILTSTLLSWVTFHLLTGVGDMEAKVAVIDVVVI